MRFDHRTVVVSGAAQGMGASHVRAFHDEGANVVIADVVSGAELAAELGDRALFVELDVTRAGDWDAAVQAAETKFGPIGVLVNNAGINPKALIEESDPDEWRRVIDVNLTGCYLGIRAVVASMRAAGGGSIINVSSIGGYLGLATGSAYVSSKWALRGLTKSAALELGRDKIRVNSVHPGTVETPLFRRAVGQGVVPDVTGLALGRVADPSELSKLVLFLASDDASYSTGSEFIADGGFGLGQALS